MWVEGKYHERAEGCCVSQLNPIDTNIYHKYQKGLATTDSQKVVNENCFLRLGGPEKKM